MWQEPFMQRALLAAICLGPLCALLGVFVTARRMSFFSDTISHGALAGVAFGVLLGIADLTLPLILSSLLVAGAVFWLREKTELLTDTIMALLLSGSVALGILVLSLLKSRPGDIHGFLFGDILAIGWRDVLLAAVLGFVIGGLVLSRINELSLITAQPEMAHVCGIRVRRANLLFLLGLTLTVAVAIRLLGIILVTALIVIPPAAARLVSFNLRQHLGWSVLAGLLTAFAGTVLSYQLDVPCGPMIVLTAIGLFLLALIFSPAGRRRTQTIGAP